MTKWCFKISDQRRYNDKIGVQYVFYNIHSTSVKKDDMFIYLDKQGNNYHFTAVGKVLEIVSRVPTENEVKLANIPNFSSIFVAKLSIELWFDPPIDVRSNSEDGKRNRKTLCIEDMKGTGTNFSPSIVNLDKMSKYLSNEKMEKFDLYQKIVEMGINIDDNSQLSKDSLYDIGYEEIIPPKIDSNNFAEEDSYGITRRRKNQKKFQQNVLFRDTYLRCLICGTTLRHVLVAAHILPYAKFKKQRNNPGNGLCLCRFCHSAYDKEIIEITENGDILLLKPVDDKIALSHFRSEVITINERIEILKKNGNVPFIKNRKQL